MRVHERRQRRLEQRVVVGDEQAGEHAPQMVRRAEGRGLVGPHVRPVERVVDRAAELLRVRADDLAVARPQDVSEIRPVGVDVGELVHVEGAVAHLLEQVAQDALDAPVHRRVVDLREAPQRARLGPGGSMDWAASMFTRFSQNPKCSASYPP